MAREAALPQPPARRPGHSRTASGSRFERPVLVTRWYSRAVLREAVAGLHVTLFAFTATNEVKPTRLDIDDIEMTEIPATMCR